MNLNRVHPLLLKWAGDYIHLREVTTTDVIAATELLSGSRRRQTLTALRSLFGHCKKTGRIFRDPTRGVHDGQRPLILIQPLQPAEIDQATAAAVTPAARLAVALAAVHAARPKTIRELHLGDVNLGNRRLVIMGRARPLDDLTRHLLLAWLQHRGRRWPGTANPHLIVNQQTAMTTRPVSENWLTENCRGLTATLERLRVEPATRGSPHPRCRPPPPRRRIRNRRHHRHQVRDHRTPAPGDHRRAPRGRFPRTQGSEQPIEHEASSVPAEDPSVHANSGQSPGRSPNPPCEFLRNGLSTVAAIRRGWGLSRGWGSCCLGSGTG